ncbi:hypothetical protein DL93DRAFT_783327 [Clavulina sp. PMI_390]|nr:hypothetical protein DL93DRAFT_783327 [Clavulina sp. PMI_390]
MLLRDDAPTRILPSLKFLHILLFHDDFERFLDSDANPIELDMSEFKSFLDAEFICSAQSLERLWIDCARPHMHTPSGSCSNHALRFRAEKAGKEWEVDARRCNCTEEFVTFPQ